MSIAGLDYPDSGRIEIGGMDVTWVPPQRRNLGMVFHGFDRLGLRAVLPRL